MFARTAWAAVKTASTQPRYVRSSLVAAGGAATLLGVYTLTASPFQADAPATPFVPPPPTEHRFPLLSTYAWGNNKARTAAPSSSAARLPVPTYVPLFDGVGFRDVQITDTLGVAIDADGHLVQWGPAFDADHPCTPTKTQAGYDLQRVQISGQKIYALTRGGHIYVFPTKKAMDAAPSSGTTWLGTASKEGRLQADAKFTEIAAGAHHVLALSRDGRVYSVPSDAHANDYGQLGYSNVKLTSMDPGSSTLVDARLEPKVVRKARLGTAEPAPATSTAVPCADTELQYAPVLRPIPSLQDVRIAQIAAGSLHSVARTPDGRVLTWGCNMQGQLGLGARLTFDTIAVPSEVSWPTSLVGKQATCTQIAAGGMNTFFVVQSRGAPMDNETRKQQPALSSRIDVLAVGGGQRGTLGHGQRNQAYGVPVRVKGVSGLQEYSEQTHSMQPIGVHAISVGASGHCAVVMDAPSLGDETRRDVYVWGNNDQAQLGHGKKGGHTAVPSLLTLVPRTASSTSHADGAPDAADNEEESSMPLHRILLVSRAKERVQTFDHTERRGRAVEQRIVAGESCMAIYPAVL